MSIEEIIFYLQPQTLETFSWTREAHTSQSSQLLKGAILGDTLLSHGQTYTALKISYQIHIGNVHT